eukprot:6269944-Amphidinium_carterae.1
MPVGPCMYEHRPKEAQMPEWSAMVTQNLSPKEIAQDKLAQEAMSKEYKRHQNKTWDETGVREYEDVVREARAKKETIHVGRVFGIAGIKGYELPVGHPQR